MGKYFKSFEDLKREMQYADGETVDLIDDDDNAQADYSRRSRFGRNPESNVEEFQAKQHSSSNFDDWLVVVICLNTK